MKAADGFEVVFGACPDTKLLMSALTAWSLASLPT